MQEDTGSVTQKYMYNGTLSRHLAHTFEEELLVSSPTSATEKDAFQIADEMTGKAPSVIPDVHSSNGAKQKQEPKQVTAEGQGLLLAEAKPSVEAPFPPEIETPLPPSLPTPAYPISVPQKSGTVAKQSKEAKRDAGDVYILREQCRQLYLSLFFREDAPVRSLGFTSSLNGEGKSFLALVTADLLAQDSSEPVTLLECNWENPFLHQHFGFAPTPGLAEWLHGECSETAIHRRISRNLTVIPAGDGKHDAVALLQHVRQRGLVNMLGHSNGLLVVDLPSVVTTAYGSLAASLVESLIVVVRAGVTTDTMIAEACTRLNDLPVHGLILNQMTSQVPRWLRQIL
jgi:Mrp family chromosome partitioning ATPase